MSRLLIDDFANLPAGLLKDCRPMPLPRAVLLCPPDYFDVIDVKNPHMADHVGKVDRAAAKRQWTELKATFERCGIAVETIPPLPNCEDMVFCANQTLPGLDPAGRRVCLLAKMRHASRQREVPAFANWFSAHGYEVAAAPSAEMFEGCGDAIWHPERGLIWGGYGHRTAPEAYERVAKVFNVPVIRLKLISDRFYHLDTCFCAIDERTVLIDPTALEPRGRALIQKVFERVIECPPDEAAFGMACNATALPGGQVIIQRGNSGTVHRLRDLGYQVHEVETDEFLKSGGSVFCLKMLTY